MVTRVYTHTRTYTRMGKSDSKPEMIIYYSEKGGAICWGRQTNAGIILKALQISEANGGGFLQKPLFGLWWKDVSCAVRKLPMGTAYGKY